MVSGVAFGTLVSAVPAAAMLFASVVLMSIDVPRKVITIWKNKQNLWQYNLLLRRKQCFKILRLDWYLVMRSRCSNLANFKN
jgi:hypothetical protein